MKKLYVTGENNKLRFVLGEYENKPLICIGCNPSTATDEEPDNTMKLVSATVEANSDKYDGYIMFNLYPLRATDPKALKEVVKDESYIADNIKYFEEVLRDIPEDDRVIWAAWGKPVTEISYLAESLKRLVEVANKYKCKWVEKTQNGKTFANPHHPLYLKATEELKYFDIDKYMSKLK